MIRELMIVLFAIAGGFVVSGVASSSYRLVTRQQGDLRIKAKSYAGRALAVGLIALTGPSVLFQNAFATRHGKNTPKGQFAIACAVVLFWSFLLGLFTLNILLVINR